MQRHRKTIFCSRILDSPWSVKFTRNSSVVVTNIMCINVYNINFCILLKSSYNIIKLEEEREKIILKLLCLHGIVYSNNLFFLYFSSFILSFHLSITVLVLLSDCVWWEKIFFFYCLWSLPNVSSKSPRCFFLLLEITFNIFILIIFSNTVQLLLDSRVIYFCVRCGDFAIFLFNYFLKVLWSRKFLYWCYWISIDIYFLFWPKKNQRSYTTCR